MAVRELYLSNGDVQLSEHFMLHEAKSPDSDLVLVSSELVDMVEQLRAAVPGCAYIILSSGYRNDAESIRVGGNAGDPHTQGKAWDLGCFTVDNQIIDGRIVCCKAQDLGFNGIGAMGDWIHLDVCERHWWGDEIAKCNVSDWYDYFGIERPVVEQPVEIPQEVENVAEIEPQAQSSSIDEVANAVIRGDYGNGDERKQNLEAAGYNYDEVQAKVDEIFNQPSEPTDPQIDIDEIARQVIRGEWGNGQDRAVRLDEAGYDYGTIQAKVDELLS